MFATSNTLRQTTPRPAPLTAFDLAKRYAEQYQATQDKQFAFAAVKHAANAILLKPITGLNSSGDITVTVASAVAHFDTLRKRLALYLPTAVFAEENADYSFGVYPDGKVVTLRPDDPNASISQRSRLIVKFPARVSPEKPLTDNDLQNMLYEVFMTAGKRVVEQKLCQWMSLDINEAIPSIRERNWQTRNFCESVLEEVQGEVGMTARGLEFLRESITTRRDGRFYWMVAEILQQEWGTSEE